MSQYPDQSTDQFPDSGHGIARTYGRTNEDELVTLRETGCGSDARDVATEAIGVIEWGRSLRFAEVNGAKVIAAVDLPEPVLHALATLVDAISQAVCDARDRERQADADRPRTMCRWHPGQYADFCGPCRSEEIGAA